MKRWCATFSFLYLTLSMAGAVFADGGLCGGVPKTDNVFQRQRVRVVGSSTVFPFSSAMAEHFGVMTSFPAPIIESTGSGGGIHMFCRGVGSSTPDVVNASRPITDAERRLCKKNKVVSVGEFILGQDGLVLATMRQYKTLPQEISRHDLFKALSAYVVQDGAVVKNPTKLWSDIRPEWPKQPIKVLGAPPTAGSYDVFLHKALKPICATFPPLKAKCGQIRNDGAYVAASEHSSVITHKLMQEPEAVGIISYNFYKQNKDLLRSMSLEGEKPRLKSISEGRYPLSYQLYFYVKGEHFPLLPGLREWTQSLLHENSVGPSGNLVRLGLVPLDKKGRAQQRRMLKKLR